MEIAFKVFCLRETGTSHTNRYRRFSIPGRDGKTVLSSRSFSLLLGASI